jgi:hypothetical protein
MEENKNVVNLTPKPENKKMSYEELENVAHQLSEQARKLYTRVQQLEMTNLFKRLDYLFKIVENKVSFSIDFVDKCVSEIQSIMTVSENKEVEEDKQE